MSDASQQPPIQQETPPRARRLNKNLISVLTMIAVILMLLVAVFVVQPKGGVQPHLPPPQTSKSGTPGFLTNSPRPAPEADPESLLDAARSQHHAPTAPPTRQQLPYPAPPPFNPGPFEPGRLNAQPPAPPAASQDQEAAQTPEEIPLGAYRPTSPNPFSAVRTNFTPSSISQREAPPWKASFASSLSGPTPTNQTPISKRDLQPPPAIPPFPTLSALPNLGSSPMSPTAAAAGDGKSSPPTAAPTRDLVLATPASRSHSSRLIRAGTTLELVLLTTITTQIPGDAVAHLTADVYAADGTLALPKGTRLIGSYGGHVGLADTRLAVSWDRLQFPGGGRVFKLPPIPGAQPDGSAGVYGSVNRHAGLVFGRAAILSLISAGVQLGQPRQGRNSATYTNGEIAAGAVTQELTQASREFLSRAVNVEPTITIPAGNKLHALLPYDLEIP